MSQVKIYLTLDLVDSDEDDDDWEIISCRIKDHVDALAESLEAYVVDLEIK